MTDGALAKALAAFQAEMPTVAKSKTANTGTYSYSYAGLAELSQAAMPLLGRHGLAFSCCPRRTESGHYELAGFLMHESGEEREGALPISGGTPQQLGSAITYARRYLFGAMTGLITDDDDDGALASSKVRAPAKKRAQPTPPPDDDLEGALQARVADEMTANSRGRMFALFAEHGITDPDQQRAGMSRVLGREVTSRGAVTEEEVRKVNADLASRPRPVTTP